MRVFIFLLVLVFVPTGFSQPQPRAADAWNTYRFDNGRFSIDLPSSPQEDVEKINSGEYQFDLYSQTAEVQGAIYSLSYVNFGINIDEETYVSSLFDSWAEGVVDSMPDSDIKSEEVEFKGGRARRLVALNKLVRLDGIAIYREGRLISMAVGRAAVPGNEAAEAISARAADEYFSTFHYERGIIDPVSGPVNEVEIIKPGTIYRSDYGFEIALPEGWIVVGDDAAKSGLKTFIEDKRITQKTKRELEESFEGSEILFNLQKTVQSSAGRFVFLAGFEPITGDKNASPRAIVDSTYLHFQRNLAYEPVSPPKLVSINGASFYLFKVKKEMNGIAINQHFYLKKIGGNVLQFILTFPDESLLPEMEKSLNTLKFDPK